MNPPGEWTAKEPAPVGKNRCARLDQARWRLAAERLSIKAVAGQLSVSGEFYFSHFFRPHAGLALTDFCKPLRE